MHEPQCAAVKERRGFILNLREATKFTDWKDSVLATVEGTEQELENAWSMLKGCYDEYHDDGDQMSDACTCNHQGG